jgi:hypothetical protein
VLYEPGHKLTVSASKVLPLIAVVTLGVPTQSHDRSQYAGRRQQPTPLDCGRLATTQPVQEPCSPSARGEYEQKINSDSA